MTPLDDYDRAILRLLQENNQMPQREIGAAVNLSAPSVQRRIRRMEAEGVIAANAAQVSGEAVGLPLTIIVTVELVSETPDAIDEPDRDALRQAGFSDRDIWDIAAVAGFFNMTNRLASASDMRPNAEYRSLARD